MSDSLKTASLRATEELGAKGATAERITLDYMLTQIDQMHYFTLSDVAAGLELLDRLQQRDGIKWADIKTLRPVDMSPPNHDLATKAGHLTLCIMVLNSGWIVRGYSAPLSPENYDAEKGKTFAYEDCIRQLWPLFAFHRLQQKLDATVDARP